MLFPDQSGTAAPYQAVTKTARSNVDKELRSPMTGASRTRMHVASAMLTRRTAIAQHERARWLRAFARRSLKVIHLSEMLLLPHLRI